MTNISQLRTFVNNGWTIANRRAVVSQIGKKEFNELATLAKKTDVAPVLPYYDYVMEYLKTNKVSDIKYMLICKMRGIDATWGRKLNLGTGETNGTFYAKFKKSYTGAKTFVSDKCKNARRAIFDTLKPLGCDKIHYRGESYNLSRSNELEHFNKLKNLKVGDKYEPKTNMWISDSKNYAHDCYGSTTGENVRNVRYTILANKNSKIIEMPYSRYENKIFSEGIYDDRAVFEVCEKYFDGKTLELFLKHIN